MFRSLFVAFIFASSVATAQTADDVVARYVQFIGGAKAWSRVTTLTTTGTYDYGGLVFPFTTYAKAPNQYKVVVPLKGKFYAQAYDGVKGWKIDGFKNEMVATPLTGNLAMAMANEADVELEDPLIHYQSKGHRIALEGQETVDSVLCFRLKLTRKNGTAETWFFDVANYRLVMKLAVSKNVELGGATLRTHYSDYRAVQQIKLPFKSVSEIDGQMILTVVVDDITVNAPLAAKTFQPE